MFLLALACTDPGLAPGPYVEPTVQEVWLTAGPDEIHARASSAAGSQYVYEDVVELLLDCPLEPSWFVGELPIADSECDAVP